MRGAALAGPGPTMVLAKVSRRPGPTMPRITTKYQPEEITASFLRASLIPLPWRETTDGRADAWRRNGNGRVEAGTIGGEGFGFR